ncbi:hypothetical protein [Bradyrhizobium embrapense]
MMRSKARNRRKKSQASRRGKATAAVARGHDCSTRWRKAHSELAIQLALDLHIASVRYVRSLPFFDLSVQVQMLVAETTDGRVAFDIVDARPERDLDEDGLLLLTLHQHDIRLVEIDLAAVEGQPRASNCRKIWRHRNQHVEASLEQAIDDAVAERGHSTIHALGKKVGLRHPMSMVCALICRGRLQVDLEKRHLDPHSVVRRAVNDSRVASRMEREDTTGVPGIEYGEIR